MQKIPIEEIKNKMPNEEVIQNMTELFKILGDETRSKILYVLEQGPLCVSEICECVEMTKSAVSHQLRILKQTKLVKSKRYGKEIIYSLDDYHVSTLFACAYAHITEH